MLDEETVRQIVIQDLMFQFDEKVKNNDFKTSVEIASVLRECYLTHDEYLNWISGK